MLLTAVLYSPIYFLVVKSSNPYSVISKIFYSFVIGLTFSINCATVLTTGDYFYKVLGETKFTCTEYNICWSQGSPAAGRGDGACSTW